MINKKIVIQKGFRINNNIANYLDILSQGSGRSQNELVNLALSKFFKDNIAYFVEDDILNHLSLCSESLFCGFGGITFALECNYLMIFSTNPKQEAIISDINNFPNELNFEKINLNKDQILELNHSISTAHANGTKLIDVIEYLGLNDKFKLQLSQTLFSLDYNFDDMNNWINKEFTSI